mmetsp:Transcript_17288/g.69511  ORF Transcript_17288/g.69511 Transcript_17288/m.69511 type:complete len:311 (+) Transcript_17288:206-1138(+)
MDCSIRPSKKHPDVAVVSTMDFFYPLVEDPYVQGKIACANVLSDLYAVGVTEVDSLLMALALSLDMPEAPRRIVAKELIRGFSDLAEEAGVEVSGGQTVLNPWCIVGGVASSICSVEEVIAPESAVPGNVIVLTKPLGTQLAVNAKQWLGGHHGTTNLGDLTSEQVERAYETAQASMARLNRTAARLMHTYGALAATDVTGFGILGHLTNLAENQRAAVDMEIDTLPVIAGMLSVADRHPVFQFREGFSAETSGGLLVCLRDADVARCFCDELAAIDGAPAWIVGRVVERRATEKKNAARIVADPSLVEV